MILPIMQLDATVSATATSTSVDESFTVPQNATPTTLSLAAGSGSNVAAWYLTVVGDPAYINFNGAATSANGAIAQGTFGPLIINPGTVVHVLTTKSSSTVSIIRARLT